MPSWLVVMVVINRQHNGCNQSPAPSYHEAPVREAPKEVLVDTVSEVKQADEEKKDAPVSPASSSVSTSRSTSSSYGSTSSYRYKEKEPDNMRGFDPASEDDMDDNGMSRYMENNDVGLTAKGLASLRTPMLIHY